MTASTHSPGGSNVTGGTAAISKAGTRRQRAVVNEAGIPQCFEKLMGPMAGAGDGQGGSGSAVGSNGLKALLYTCGEGSQSDAAWYELFDKVDDSKGSTVLQDIAWVFNQAGRNPSEIDPDKVPGGGALRMLKWVNTSDSNYGVFILSIWSKTITNRVEVKRQPRYFDDGRELDLLEDFQRQWKEGVAKRETEAAAKKQQTGESAGPPSGGP